MSSGLDCHSVDTLARGEMNLFAQLGRLGGISTEDQQRLLSLSDAEWSAWRRFLGDGPMPTWPNLPDMLLRLATAAYSIAVMLDPDPLGFDAVSW